MILLRDWLVNTYSRAILFIRICETRGKHESGVGYTAGKRRDRKVESGATFARRIWSETEGDEAGEDTRTQAQNIGGRQTTNCGSTESPVGEDSSREEIKAAFIPAGGYAGNPTGDIHRAS